MREHLKIGRETKISELCFASDVDEKMFWKLIKCKRCSSQLGVLWLMADLPIPLKKLLKCGSITSKF